jgi:hypothetical protein
MSSQKEMRGPRAHHMVRQFDNSFQTYLCGVYWVFFKYQSRSQNQLDINQSILKNVYRVSWTMFFYYCWLSIYLEAGFFFWADSDFFQNSDSAYGASARRSTIRYLVCYNNMNVSQDCFRSIMI